MSYSNEIFGGLLIGIGSALPLLIEGRIAGVSAYAAMSLRPKSKDGRIGLQFVIGLIVGGFAWRYFNGTIPDPNHLTLPLGFWIAAGLLVGFGARWAGGCTSGHGVCGLGRASPRSLASVLIFMSVAILTTFLMRRFL